MKKQLIKLSKILLLITFIYLSVQSCSILTKMDENTPSELEKIVKNFEKDFKLDVQVPVIFSFNLNEYTLGQASLWFSWYPMFVEINHELWQTLTIFQRKMLIYHELAHIFGLDHDNKYLKNGCASSTMHKYGMSESCINNQTIDYYINELRVKLKGI
jgi:hypothetical protein